MQRAPQLHGPALVAWLAHSLPAATAVFVAPDTDPRLLREVMPVVDACAWRVVPELSPASEVLAISAAVVLTPLGTLAGDTGPEAVRWLANLRRSLALLTPGGAVVELAHPMRVRLWQLRRWLQRARAVGGAAEQRARVWLDFGLYAVEQWAPVDWPRVLVTKGSWRIPGKVATP